MSRILDPRRKFGEHRGKSHKHVYQQRDYYPDGPEYYFDARGRECDPNTGRVFDPQALGLETYEILNQPTPKADVKDFAELNRIVKAQQEMIDRLTSIAENQQVLKAPDLSGPDKMDSMSTKQLKAYADEMGINFPPTANKATMVKLLKEAA